MSASSAGPSTPSIILFDGLCNLCNSSVNWVIDRDKRQRFVFASLQSKAAERVLGEAMGSADHSRVAERPDSIILVDEAGVHTRSTAALRIARGLGFPWSLAALAIVVPRPLRDWAYRLIARNRYRWFGVRDTCRVPTPELRARFLDADEWSNANAAGVAPTDSAIAPWPASATTGDGLPSPRPAPDAPALVDPSRPGPAWTFVLRFILCYIVLYLFPFPVGTFMSSFSESWIDWPAKQYINLKHEVVPWVADSVFGIEITIFPAGSGDTTYNYVELLVYVACALMAAITWTLARGGKLISPRTFDLFTIYVRYYLAATMLVYGIDKLLLLQMPHPGPSRLMVTYGESSPFGLLWTSVGASPGYQFFGGLAETIGAVLLFCRRTTLLGALVCMGALVNVVLLNFCYDVPVKIYSSHLLLLTLFLTAPHLGRLIGVFALNLPTAATILRPFPFRQPWLRLTAAGMKTLIILWLTVGQALMIHGMVSQMRPSGGGNPIDGFYQVESFTLDGATDRSLADEMRWVQVGIDEAGSAAVRFADGHIERLWLQMDHAARTLTVPRADQAEPSVLTYSIMPPQSEHDSTSLPADGTRANLSQEDAMTEGAIENPEVVMLEGAWDGKPLKVRLVRSKLADNLTTRGFHWINEFPFYR